MKQEIPIQVKDLLNHAAITYSRSKHTTNPGRVIRFVCGFLSVDTIVKLFAHKLGN